MKQMLQEPWGCLLLTFSYCLPSIALCMGEEGRGIAFFQVYVSHQRMARC